MRQLCEDHSDHRCLEGRQELGSLLEHRLFRTGRHFKWRSDVKRRQFIAGAIAAMASLAWGCNRKGDYTAIVSDDRVDDTARLQTALNRGGHITLDKGRRYRLSAPAGARAALVIHSDTFLDLAGATIELVPGQRCALISTMRGEHSRNIRIAGGEVVGNGVLQPLGFDQPPNFDPGIGLTPTFYLMNCDGLKLYDLRMHDTYQYAVYARGNDGTMDNLSVEGAIGGGVHITGARWQIDRVTVRNVTYFDPVNCTGNPFIVNLRDSTVGSIQCENYGFGVKFQDGCENVTVNSILAVGGDNNVQDYLVKIQGMKDKRGTALNRGIRIGSIVARNGPSSGLYIIYSDGVDIGSYQGENNGRSPHEDAANDADVLVIDSDHLHFGTLRVKGYRRHGLWIHDTVGQFSADTVEIEDAKEIDAVPMVLRSGSVVIGGKRIRIFVP